FYRGYVHWTRTGEPRFVAKLAVSVDGKVAGPGGRRMKISGDEADRFTHRQQREADAILTTAATVYADDPRLKARRDGVAHAKPVWVLARRGKFPSDAKLWKTAKVLHLVLPEDAQADPEWEARGARVHRVGGTGDALVLKALR